MVFFKLFIILYVIVIKIISSISVINDTSMFVCLLWCYFRICFARRPNTPVSAKTNLVKQLCGFFPFRRDIQSQSSNIPTPLCACSCKVERFGLVNPDFLFLKYLHIYDTVQMTSIKGFNLIASATRDLQKIVLHDSAVFLKNVRMSQRNLNLIRKYFNLFGRGPVQI